MWVHSSQILSDSCVAVFMNEYTISHQILQMDLRFQIFNSTTVVDCAHVNWIACLEINLIEIVGRNFKITKITE